MRQHYGDYNDFASNAERDEGFTESDAVKGERMDKQKGIPFGGQNESRPTQFEQKVTTQRMLNEKQDLDKMQFEQKVTTQRMLNEKQDLDKMQDAVAGFNFSKSMGPKPITPEQSKETQRILSEKQNPNKGTSFDGRNEPRPVTPEQSAETQQALNDKSALTQRVLNEKQNPASGMHEYMADVSLEDMSPEAAGMYVPTGEIARQMALEDMSVDELQDLGLDPKTFAPIEDDGLHM